ncbi:hypothetical protein [Paenibacillus sp. J22TS3]|uniref:hypothetical protein n=1 Tax=Paenibacillus sp. J22TS3 TaxID=2807192 RepID=UPI001B22DF26|nr:hypothetical protein [Paenibacillus sp. J22TS3]GIP24049.1 hypothetical protein J22TS3_43240 [Paenibacillus sp. J22TS3]
MQTAVVISILVITASHQVGTTFGEFHTEQDNTAVIQACGIFPSEIRLMLEDLTGHLNIAVQLKNTLSSGPSTDTGEISPHSFTGRTLEELSSDEQLILSRISVLQGTSVQLSSRLADNEAAWQSIRSEIQQSADKVNGIIGEINQQPSNCLVIRDQASLLQLSGQLTSIPGLSAELSGRIKAVMDYLKQLQTLDTTDAGNDQTNPSDFSSTVTGVPDYSQELIHPVSIDTGQDSLISEEWAQEYRQLQSELQASLNSCTTELGSLSAQLSEIQAAIAAERSRLEELEKVKRAAEIAKSEQDKKEAQEKKDVQDKKHEGTAPGGDKASSSDPAKQGPGHSGGQTSADNQPGNDQKFPLKEAAHDDPNPTLSHQEDVQTAPTPGSPSDKVKPGDGTLPDIIPGDVPGSSPSTVPERPGTSAASTGGA